MASIRAAPPRDSVRKTGAGSRSATDAAPSDGASTAGEQATIASHGIQAIHAGRHRSQLGPRDLPILRLEAPRAAGSTRADMRRLS